MHYRKFGKLDEQVSLLGFGAMRLPCHKKEDGSQGEIIEKEAIELIRAAIDGGVNYIDTAYPYHDGHSEPLVAKALKDGYREKVYLATKNPSWELKEKGDFTKYLDEQLEKLEVDCIDFYLQHAFNPTSWETLQSINFYDEAMKAKADGKIKYFGFSFHAEYELFEEIINAHNWDFTMIQYNYLDEEHQAGLKGLKLAASKNMGVVAMEPLRGGSMGDKMPEDIKEEFKNAAKSPVELALRWLANQPEVSVILSGMSTLEQVKDNLAILKKDDMLPGKALTDQEAALIKHVEEVWNKRILVGCTSCNYCLPCPTGVNIPECFAAYNIYGSSISWQEDKAKTKYKELKEAGTDASKCIRCGACSPNCPQTIDIPEKLEQLHKVLG